MAFDSDDFDSQSFSSEAFDGLGGAPATQTWNAWGRAWGDAWGLSWGLTYEANQEDLMRPGGTRRKRITALPGWYTPQNPPAPAAYRPDDEEAALMCIGAL